MYLCPPVISAAVCSKVVVLFRVDFFSGFPIVCGSLFLYLCLFNIT